jgi:pimeloyl-ACP methyl ester carboxylesterase
VLLVHGAFADASNWSGVIRELLAAGIDVVAPANPLRGLVSDARYIANVADEIDGPVLLVGHSYGGAVITVAGSLAANTLGLAYVAGFALDEGESTLDVSGRFPDTLLIAALRPASFPEAEGDLAAELYIDRDAFPRAFAADLPLPTAAAAATAQRPIAAAALEEKAPSAAWRSLASWYVVATADRIIHPDAQVAHNDRRLVESADDVRVVVNDLLDPEMLDRRRIAAQRGLLALPASTLKTGFPVLKNPANNHRAVPLTPEEFHYAFTNTLSDEESLAVYERYAVPGPGRVLFQGAFANFNPHSPAAVDFKNSSRAPLLFIAAGDDHVAPAALNEANLKHYRKSDAITELKEFPGRSHYTLGQEGWEEVADYALDWALSHAVQPASV